MRCSAIFFLVIWNGIAVYVVITLHTFVSLGGMGFVSLGWMGCVYVAVALGVSEV